MGDTRWPNEAMSHAVNNEIYPFLERLGLTRNREKFYLAEAGHRGFSVDVGTSHGEILIRVQDGQTQVARIPILNPEGIESALIEVGTLTAFKMKEVSE